MQETYIRSLGQEDPLEKEIVTQSGILAWEIPWREKPDELWSMDHRDLHDSASEQQQIIVPYFQIYLRRYGKI